jgi:ankyrin repeat protein
MKLRFWPILALAFVGCGPQLTTSDVAGAIRSHNHALLAKAIRSDPLGRLDDDGTTNLLQVAVDSGDRVAAELLLRHGAHNYGSGRGSWQDVPLNAAAKSDDIEMVRLLLGYGADPLWARSLDFVQERPNGQAIFELLLKAGANPNGPDAAQRGLGGTLLLSAVSEHALARAQALLNAGADPNGRSEYGSLPLNEAALRLDRTEVKLLIRDGADKRKRDASGKTALDAVGDLVGIMKKYGGKHGA